MDGNSMDRTYCAKGESARTGLMDGNSMDRAYCAKGEKKAEAARALNIRSTTVTTSHKMSLSAI
jgi:hypothetical protein